jgi:hypothetical protein
MEGQAVTESRRAFASERFLAETISQRRKRFMPQPPSSADLRRWAAQCAEQAKLAQSPEQRERLLKMEQAFLAAAEDLYRLEAGQNTKTD